MTRRFSLCAALAAVVLAGCLVTAAPAGAQGSLSQQYHHRQKTKNQWRNVAIGSGAVALYGLLKHDSTLTVAGAAGALYSANRYEQDRRGQNRIGRARAAFYGRRHFYRHGHRYTRRTVYRHGHKYYQFVRG